MVENIEKKLVRGFSVILSEVQIRLCGSLSQQKIGRNQNARRLDAEQDLIDEGLLCVL